MFLNPHRIMWLLVFYDLPTETKADRKRYAEFRDATLKDGFSMFQFSIYVRHCGSRDNMEVHLKRVRKLLPAKGKIGILCITDKQFGEIELFDGKKEKGVSGIPQQLELF